MNTFCVLPWYSVELPKNSPCCLLPKNANVDQIKNDLLAGIKPEACTKCWAVEDAGNPSRRQLENQFLDYKLNRNLNLIQQDCIDGKNIPLLYQLTTSNLCNQACVSCDSNLSSKWADVKRKNNLPAMTPVSLNIENLDINYAQARRISLIGGEPLFDPKTFKILQNLIDINNTDCFVTLVTNGSIKLNSLHVDMLKKLTDLNICISIDGTDTVFEYLRWPGKWTKLVENIDHYRSITPNISVSYTISALNVLYYDQTVDWFKKNNLRYNHNVVQFPQWLAVKNMPVELKHYLKNHDFFKDFCKITGNEIKKEKFLNYLVQQDKMKKTDHLTALPELCRILQ